MQGRTNADQWLSEVRAALLDFERDVDEAPLRAAHAGVAVAQSNHPYTDRTGRLTQTARAEKAGKGRAAMVWPPHYAGYVDRGTSRSRPYPYTPLAIEVAEHVLKDQVTQAVSRLSDRLTR